MARESEQQAAMIISDLLASTLRGPDRQLYAWEKAALRWLSEHWKHHPSTQINMWTADRVREFERGDHVLLMH